MSAEPIPEGPSETGETIPTPEVAEIIKLIEGEVLPADDEALPMVIDYVREVVERTEIRIAKMPHTDDRWQNLINRARQYNQLAFEEDKLIHAIEREGIEPAKALIRMRELYAEIAHQALRQRAEEQSEQEWREFWTRICMRVRHLFPHTGEG